MLNRFAVFFCVLAVGCATGPSLPITQPPVDMRKTQSLPFQNFDRIDQVSVRTIVRKGTSWSEIGEVLCHVKGRGFERHFTSPAILNIPVFFGKTDEMAFECSGTVENRNLRTSKKVTPKNLSAPENEGVTLSVGTGGTSVEGVVSIRDRKKDRFDYPSSVTLTFAPDL